MTPRQLQTLRLLCEGNRGSQIARRMGLNIATIKTYMQDLYRISKARNQAELAVWAERAGHLDESVLLPTRNELKIGSRPGIDLVYYASGGF